MLSARLLFAVFCVILQYAIAQAQPLAHSQDCGTSESNTNAVARALGVCEAVRELVNPPAPAPNNGPENPLYELFSVGCGSMAMDQHRDQRT